MNKKLNVEKYDKGVQNRLKKIEDVFKKKSINIEVQYIKAGPAETHFIFSIDDSVKIAQIKKCKKDLQEVLKEKFVEVRAIIEDESRIIVEAKNKEQQIIDYDDIYERFQSGYSYGGEIPLGVMVNDNIFPVDFFEKGSCLIRGGEKSGKTNLVKIILASLMKLHSDSIMEFVICGENLGKEYDKITKTAYVSRKIVDNGDKLEKYLGELEKLMEDRYIILGKARCENIDTYNRIHYTDVMKYTFVVIENISNLIFSNAEKSDEIMNRIIRLLQMSRAVGIHLIEVVDDPGDIDDNENWVLSCINCSVSIYLKGGSDVCGILESEYDLKKLFPFGDAVVSMASECYCDDDSVIRIQVPLLKES